MPGDTLNECTYLDVSSINSLAPGTHKDSTKVLFQDPSTVTPNRVDNHIPIVAPEKHNSIDHEPVAPVSDDAENPQPLVECEDCHIPQNGDKGLSPAIIKENLCIQYKQCKDENVSSISSYNVNVSYGELNKLHFPKGHSRVYNDKKLSAYKTEESRKHYVFHNPANEAKDEHTCLTNDRNILEVFGDVLGIIVNQYDPKDIEWLSNSRPAASRNKVSNNEHQDYDSGMESLDEEADTKL